MLSNSHQFFQNGLDAYSSPEIRSYPGFGIVLKLLKILPSLFILVVTHNHASSRFLSLGLIFQYPGKGEQGLNLFFKLQWWVYLACCCGALVSSSPIVLFFYVARLLTISVQDLTVCVLNFIFSMINVFCMKETVKLYIALCILMDTWPCVH